MEECSDEPRWILLSVTEAQQVKKPCSDYSSMLPNSICEDLSPNDVWSFVCFSMGHSRKSPEEPTRVLWICVLVRPVSLIRGRQWGHQWSEAWHTLDQVQICEPAMLKMRTGLWSPLKVLSLTHTPTHIPQKVLFVQPTVLI